MYCRMVQMCPSFLLLMYAYVLNKVNLAQNAKYFVPKRCSLLRSAVADHQNTKLLNEEM